MKIISVNVCVHFSAGTLGLVLIELSSREPLYYSMCFSILFFSNFEDFLLIRFLPLCQCFYKYLNLSLQFICIIRTCLEKMHASNDHFIYYFWLCWVLVAVWASHCSGFSFCRAQALGSVGFRGCSSHALEHRLSSCRARVQLLRGMWDLPGSGMEPVSPALAGGFFTTKPPEKPSASCYRLDINSF